VLVELPGLEDVDEPGFVFGEGDDRVADAGGKCSRRVHESFIALTVVAMSGPSLTDTGSAPGGDLPYGKAAMGRVDGPWKGQG
jgi:hypothetical protein